MDRLRLGSFSKGDHHHHHHLTRRSMSHVMTSPPVPEVPSAESSATVGGQQHISQLLTSTPHQQPPPQTPRCVIVQRDERGYGLTVSGDNPVFVQEVRPGGAAARGGVQEGDRILKVNGTLVTSANHQEVVQLIRSGQYVALTLIGPSPGQHHHSAVPAQSALRSFPGLVRGTSFIQGSLTPNQTRSTASQKKQDDRGDRITAPQPVDADIRLQCNNTVLQTIQKMHATCIQERQRLLLKIAEAGAEADSSMDRASLDSLQRTIDRVEKQMAQIRRSQGPKSVATTPPPGANSSREPTPDVGKQAPRRLKNSATQSIRIASSASMDNIPFSPPQVTSLSNMSNLSTPPKAHIFGNHQRQRSSPDSLIYRSPTEEGSATGLWNPTGPSPGTSVAGTGQLLVPDLVKSPLGEPAVGGGAPNEAFEYDDDDSSPLLQQQPGLVKPMANRPLPPLALPGSDTSENRILFEHQESTESDTGLCLFTTDQAGLAAMDEGGMLGGLGESPLKVWKVLRQPIEVAMFLHYLLSNNKNAAPFLFYVIVEQYKNGKFQDMSKWAYEITSTFLAPNGPLCIDPTLEDGVLQNIDSCMRLVDEGHIINEGELRDIFVHARKSAMRFLKPQLEEFQRDIEAKTFDCHQTLPDGSSGDTTSDIIKNWETILLNLCKTLFPLQDQVDSLPNQKSALLSAITTVLKLTVVKSEAGLKMLEHLPTFVSKEKSRLKLFPPRAKKSLVMTTHGHSFQGQHYNRVTHCSVCQDILWGVGDQGLQCGTCDMNIHKQCFKNVDENCVGEGTRNKKAARRTTTSGSLFRKDDNDSAGEPDKMSGGSGGSPRSASRAPVGRSESFRQRRESRNALRKRSDPNIPRSKSDVDAEDKPRLDKALHSDSDMDCDDDLPKWEDLVGFETVRQLKPKEKKRQDVLNELFHTERMHVRKLKVLNAVYFEPLSKLLDQSLLDKLFPNLHELIQIHSELNQKMKFKRKQEAVIGNVGGLMLDFFTGEGGTKLEIAIATFCKDQTRALEDLKLKQKKDPKLQQFLAEASMKKECAKLHLKEIIATTYQRLTKYPLLLDQVLKYTQPGDEYGQINLARDSAKRILAKVNRTIGEIANRNRVRDVEKHLEVWPPKEKDTCDDRFKDDRRSVDDGSGKKKSPKIELHPLFSEPTLSKHKLIYEGVLEWKLTKQKTIDITAMLFDEFLILLQKQDEKYHLRYHQRSISEDNKVTYPPVIEIPRKDTKNSISTRDVATNPRGFFLVTLKQHYMYEFVAHSASDKNKWLDLIHNLDKYLEESDEPPLIAALPSPATTEDDPKEASKPIIRRPEEDRVYQILEEEPLLQYCAAVTVEPPVTQQLETAQSVATLSAQLERKDAEIRRLLAEKYAIIAEMMGLPPDGQYIDSFDAVDTPPATDEPADALALLLKVMARAGDLQSLINDALRWPLHAISKITSATTVDSDNLVGPHADRVSTDSGMCPRVASGGPTACCCSRMQPSIPAHEAMPVYRRLNASVMALGGAVGMFDRQHSHSVTSTSGVCAPTSAVLNSDVMPATSTSAAFTAVTDTDEAILSARSIAIQEPLQRHIDFDSSPVRDIHAKCSAVDPCMIVSTDTSNVADPLYANLPHPQSRLALNVKNNNSNDDQFFFSGCSIDVGADCDFLPYLQQQRIATSITGDSINNNDCASNVQTCRNYKESKAEGRNCDNNNVNSMNSIVCGSSNHNAFQCSGATIELPVSLHTSDEHALCRDDSASAATEEFSHQPQTQLTEANIVHSSSKPDDDQADETAGVVVVRGTGADLHSSDPEIVTSASSVLQPTSPPQRQQSLDLASVGGSTTMQ